MDITAGTRRHGAQKVPGYNGVRVGPADASGRLRGDATGSVGAQSAADALEPEGALGALASSNGLSALLQVLHP